MRRSRYDFRRRGVRQFRNRRLIARRTHPWMNRKALDLIASLKRDAVRRNARRTIAGMAFKRRIGRNIPSTLITRFL